MSEIEQFPVPPSERDKISEDVQFQEQASETKERKGESSGSSYSQQIKAVQKEEETYKKNDEHLIKVLLLFIKQGKDETLIELINALLERNIPAPFIVASLSLIYHEVINTLSEQETSFSYDPKDANQALTQWFTNLLNASLKYPHKILPALSNSNNNADEHVQTFMKYLVVQFYNSRNIQPPLEHIDSYVADVLTQVITRTDTAIKERKTIEK